MAQGSRCPSVCLISSMHEVRVSSDFLGSLHHFHLPSLIRHQPRSSSCYPSTSPRKSSKITCATSPKQMGSTDESFSNTFSKLITDKCLFRLQHLTMSPSMLFRKQPCSWRFHRNTPSTVRTGPFESLRTTPTSCNLFVPSQERWCSTEFRRTRVSWQQESQRTTGRTQI